MTKTTIGFVVLTLAFAMFAFAGETRDQTPIAADDARQSFRVLATNKTSTLEKELNEAAAQGYAFEAVMGGPTLGGDEVVVVMSKLPDFQAGRMCYALLATNKTSTMQKELEAMSALGFVYRGQSVAETSFGGQQVVVILERDTTDSAAQYDYQLLATTRTSTMQKELNKLADSGFEVKGLTVAKTAFGGNELVTILSRRHTPATSD